MKGLIETLVEKGLINEKQLKEAKDKQIGAKKPIQELLVEMGFVREEDLTNILSEIFKMPISDLPENSIDSSVMKLIPFEMAKRYGVFPVRKLDNNLILAMSNPADVMVLDDIEKLINLKISPILSTNNKISANIEKYYHSDELLYNLLKNVVDENKGGILKKGRSWEDRFEVETTQIEMGPLVKLINFIMSDAVKSRASDIHIEPQENSVKVRFRIDGDLRNIIDLPSKFLAPLVARIKIMGSMDLAERRKPQDGRTGISVGDRNIDLRISVIPTHFGEKIVLRLLDPNQAKIRLDSLGFSETEMNLFKELCKKPQGMILITGPTGSGKTSTLYAALNFIKSETKNIVTLEDPIEYLMEGINQIQINPIKDLTFASGLRSILRQDPNVILVGEIRDKETADIAFRSSLTGHLVFSTLHTNNTVSS
ncbi:MAG: ATPase, T2SS/T4P/T4SS family, partial [bacterium]